MARASDATRVLPSVEGLFLYFINNDTHDISSYSKEGKRKRRGDGGKSTYHNAHLDHLFFSLARALLYF
jgi:hypothetical protein